MKCFIALMLFCTNNIFAQHVDQPVTLPHYALNEFSAGTIKMKSGETFDRYLNYNILTSEMIFYDGAKYLALANPENVDTVNISERKFIPLNKKFYEVLVNSNMPLLLEVTGTIIEPGKSIGYGATTTTGAIDSYKWWLSSGGAYNLKLPEGYKVIPRYNYFIIKDGSLEKVSNGKQLSKIFPDKKDMINDLVKKDNINFSKREDIIMVVKQVE